MRTIVIDASMAAAWTLDDEKTKRTDRILNEVKNNHPITTSLFWHEYRNLLVTNQKRGRLLRGRVSVLLQDMRQLEMEECRQDNDENVVSLAFRHNLSAYDAAYLALAMQGNALLATNDKKLARAAWLEGIELHTALNQEDFSV